MFEPAAFHAVADHFCRYVRHEHLDVDEYEIEEALAAWLPMIQAPNNLRGLGIVFRRRCSLYVLLTIFTPPDSQDFALLGSWV